MNSLSIGTSGSETSPQGRGEGGILRIVEKFRDIGRNNHEMRVQEVDEAFFGSREPSQHTKDTYAGVLADEYVALLTVFPRIEEDILRSNPSLQKGTPEFEDALIQSGLERWHIKMHEVMSRIPPPSATDPSGNISPETLRMHYLQEFKNLTGSADDTARKDWNLVGMLVTKKHIEAIQTATGGQFTAEKSGIGKRIGRRARSTVVSPIGQGLIDRRTNLNAFQKITTGWFQGIRDSVAQKEHEAARTDREKREISYYKDASYWARFSDVDVAFDPDLPFDPDRQVGGRVLSATQKLIAEKYRHEYQPPGGEIDHGGVIEDDLRKLIAVQADTHWTYFRHEIRTADDMNQVVLKKGNAGTAQVEPNRSYLMLVETGVEGVKRIGVRNDVLAADRLEELMGRARDRQKPEIAKEGRVTLREAVDNQIKSLSQTIEPQDVQSQEKREHAKLQMNRLEEEIAELTELGRVDGGIQEVDTDIARKKGSVQSVLDLRDGTQDTPGTLGYCKNTLNTAEKELKSAERARDAAQKKVEFAQDELETIIPQIGAINLNLPPLQRNIDTLQSKLQAFSGELNDQQKNEKVQIEHAIATETARRDSLHGQLAQYLTRAGYTGEIQDVNKVQEFLNSRLGKLNEDASSNDSLLSLQETLDTAEVTVAEKTSAKEKAQKQLEEVQAQIDARKDELEAIAELEKRKKTLENRRIDLRKKYKYKISASDPEGESFTDTSCRGKITQKRTELAGLQKDAGLEVFVAEHQREVLKTYKDEILPEENLTLIQTRAMAPNSLFRLHGEDVEGASAVSRFAQYRPEVPMAYAEIIRIFGGDDALSLAASGQEKFEKFAQVITPQLFFDVFRADSRREQVLARLLNAPSIPARFSVYDPRLQTPEIQQMLYHEVGPHLVSEINAELQKRARAGTLGAYTPEEIAAHTLARQNKISAEDADTKIKEQKNKIEENRDKAEKEFQAKQIDQSNKVMSMFDTWDIDDTTISVLVSEARSILSAEPKLLELSLGETWEVKLGKIDNFSINTLPETNWTQAQRMTHHVLGRLLNHAELSKDQCKVALEGLAAEPEKLFQMLQAAHNPLFENIYEVRRSIQRADQPNASAAEQRKLEVDADKIQDQLLSSQRNIIEQFGDVGEYSPDRVRETMELAILTHLLSPRAVMVLESAMLRAQHAIGDPISLDRLMSAEIMTQDEINMINPSLAELRSDIATAYSQYFSLNPENMGKPVPSGPIPPTDYPRVAEMLFLLREQKAGISEAVARPKAEALRDIVQCEMSSLELRRGGEMGGGQYWGAQTEEELFAEMILFQGKYSAGEGTSEAQQKILLPLQIHLVQILEHRAKNRSLPHKEALVTDPDQEEGSSSKVNRRI